jgi:hypothetical protein
MATSTLIQNLNTGYTDVFGATVSVPNTSDRRQTETFLASATVAVGDAVAFDLSKSVDSDKTLYVIKADTDVATSTAVVGIVLASADSDGSLTAGSKIKVALTGVVLANVDGATVAGSRLRCGATAGQLAIAADINEGGAATVPQYPVVAIAMEADTANFAKVLMLKQF